MTARALMDQGKSSDRDQSTLVAGLGRALRCWGMRVAPFKRRKMSLSSAVASDGGEIKPTAEARTPPQGATPR